MLLAIVLILVGFLLLIKGADWLVDGASALAKKYNVSDLAIGLTVVAFGTSAPELVVNGIASFQNHTDIIFGNVIGSNNFNLFMILGIVGLIMPINVQASTVWKEIPFSFFAVIALFIFTNELFFQDYQILSRLEGIFLLIMFAGFIFYIFKQMKTEEFKTDLEIVQMSNLKIWIYIIFGLGGLILGGHLVVESAVEVAKLMGISEKIIGLTIIAAGTSLPELVTSVVAAFKKNSDIAIGNIIGSNIFNIFLIMGVSSVIGPILYNSSFNFDIYFLAGGTIFLFTAMFLGQKGKLDRWEAALLLISFIAYTIFLINNE